MSVNNWKIGDRIRDRWEIHRIMQGGMGIIYVVYDHEWETVYAAKTFRDEVFARSPAIAEHFFKEVLTWVNLDAHPNIAEAQLVQEIQGKPFLFLEYVSGGDLSGWIGSPRLTEDQQVLLFAIQWCDGMTHALSKGIAAHRDVKPQNCLVTKDATLKVTDFGLAKATAMQSEKSGRGGTPAYMAPEQWDNFELADHRADIYSFGVMFYQLLTGRLPFEGRDLDEYELLHKSSSPPPLSTRSKEVKHIIEKCLAKDPADRYEEIGALRNELAEVYRVKTGEIAPKPASGSELDAQRWNNKGASLDVLGRYREAIDCFDKSIQIDGQRAEPWSNKGGSLHWLGQWDEALMCVERAIKIEPEYANAWVNKGGTLLTLGKTEEAIECFDHALKISPFLEEAYYNKGSAFHGKDEYEKAIELYDRVIEINPRHDRALSNKGFALQTMSFVEQAIDYYDRAITINPHNAVTWYNRGNAMYALQRLDEALESYDRATGINPGYATAWNNKGRIFIDLNRTEQALRCFERAIEFDPGYATAWNNKGWVLLVSNLIEEALSCFERAIELESNDETAWRNKGLALQALGFHEKAIICFDRALSINSGSAWSWRGKAESLQRSGQIEKAIESYDRATEINPQDEISWFRKGAILGSLDRFHESIVCFDRVIDLNPEDADAWFNKGLALAKMTGQTNQAIRCFEEAFRRGSQQAAQLLAALKQQIASRTPPAV